MDASSIISLMQYAPKPFGFLSSLPQVAGTAYGLLSNPKGTLQGLSDKYLGTHFGQSELMQEQGQINSGLANEERAWQERMIAEDRAYNSIENQMRMMRSAGLNPGLLYGNIQDLGGTAPNAGAASVGLGSPQYGAVPEHALLSAQVDNIKADTAKKYSDIQVNQADVNRINADADRLRELAEQTGLDNVVRSATILSEISSKNAQFELSANEAREKAKYVAESVEYNYKILKEMYDKAVNDKNISAEQLKEVQAAVRSAEARASIDEYAEQNKEFEYWFNKAMAAGNLLTEIISAIASLKKFGIKVPTVKQ